MRKEYYITTFVCSKVKQVFDVQSLIVIRQFMMVGFTVYFGAQASQI